MRYVRSANAIFFAAGKKLRLDLDKRFFDCAQNDKGKILSLRSRMTRGERFFDFAQNDKGKDYALLVESAR